MQETKDEHPLVRVAPDIALPEGAKLPAVVVREKPRPAGNIRRRRALWLVVLLVAAAGRRLLVASPAPDATARVCLREWSPGSR